MNSSGATFIRKSSVAIFFLSLIAFLLRLYASKFHIIMVPDYDGLAYIEMAKNAADGQLFSGIGYHPFYSWLIAIANIWVKDYQWAGMLISIIFGSCTVGIVFLLTKTLFDLKTGLISALLLALFSSHVLVSTLVLSETTFTLLIYLGLYLGWSIYESKTWISGILFGIVMGFAYLTRPEGLLIFISIFLFLSVLSYSKKDYKTMVRLFFVLITFCLIVLPYMHYLKKETGHWRISGKEVTNLPDMKNEQISHRKNFDATKLKESGLLGHILTNPKVFWDRYKDNLLITVSTIRQVVGLPILFFALVGFTSTFIGLNRYKSYSITYLSLLLSPILIAPILHPLDYRLAVPYTTVLLILGGYGIVVMQDEILHRISCIGCRIIDKIRDYQIASFLIASLLIMDASNTLGYVIEIHKEEQALIWFKYKEIGKILNKISAPDEIIMTREPLQAFYSDRKYTTLPYGNINEIIDYAKRNRVTFIIIDEGIVNRKRQLLKPMLIPLYSNQKFKEEEIKLIEDNLKVVYVTIEHGIIIYKVK